jgi:hypothetical protein
MLKHHHISRRTLLKALGWSSILPGMRAQKALSSSATVRAAIHPAIGVARVGNSPEEFFMAPDLPWPGPTPDGGYKDPSGALKRQAARFRLYGYDAEGRVTEELTAENAFIRWTVHVANKKAAWYEFNLPLDIPAAVPCRLRNRSYAGSQRQQLIIDPGPRSIEGRDAQGGAFDSGQFLGTPVYLGELRTDAQGRLLFLGGRGAAASVRNRPATTFANNDEWYDDICDGSVTAEVVIEGRSLPVDPAWVVVAPPNYAPDIVSIQTMYDVVYDALQGTLIEPSPSVSFTEHISPLLSQFSESQWVNYGFYRRFGWGSQYEFLKPDYLPQLASNDPVFNPVRGEIFRSFRNPDYRELEVHAWPPIYGDGMEFRSPDPRQLMAVTRTQYEYLRRWAEGDFAADLPESSPAALNLEDVPLDLQPRTLDKAALYFCMGGPFHPGCEMTWPMRHASMYSSPFRLRHRATENPEPELEDTLHRENMGAFLTASAPGDITRWMAIPWQTDTASCRAGYDPAFDPYLPSFWPARVPNHVLTRSEYERVLDTSISTSERRQAFDTRADWFRWLTGEYIQQINQMVRDFDKLGVIERRDGPEDGLFPPRMYVEKL